MGKFEKGKYFDKKGEIIVLHNEGFTAPKIVRELEKEGENNYNARKINEALQAWGYGGGVEVDNDSDTSNNDYTEPRVLSALDDEHKLMDIDRYCEYYNLPRKDITSYKLITHTGVPYYNLVFREKVEIEDIDYTAMINEIAVNIHPINIVTGGVVESEKVTRLVYTDTHIAMCTDEEGTALYATPWNKEELFKTLSIMCKEVIENRVGDDLIIDDLGDVLDGWEGYTTRGGHKLPQNMSSQEAFKVALEFKLTMLRTLLPYFNRIVCHNVSVDNHSGRFSMTLNHAFKVSAEAMFNNVEVYNFDKFIEHYFVGKHAFVLCHGKDHKSLKFGFKPKLDSIQIEKIDVYLKHNEAGNVFKKADFIWFEKGDSHQLLFDYSSAQDFMYMNYPALSPSSEWVQVNFKKGDRGFVIQQIDPYNRNIKLLPIIL